MPQDPRFVDPEGGDPRQYQPNFIDRQAAAGPFDGLLLVMNMPEQGFRGEYDQLVSDAVKDAHAGGWMVMYVADAETNLHRPPPHYDEADGMDFHRLFSSLGINDQFDYMPGLRMTQFAAMANAVFGRREEFSFAGRACKVVGACRIGGVAALIPLTDVRAR